MSGAEMVDGMCNQLLSSSCLSQDQYGHIGGRNGLHVFQNPFQSQALANNILEPGLGIELLFEITFLLFDPA